MDARRRHQSAFYYNGGVILIGGSALYWVLLAYIRPVRGCLARGSQTQTGLRTGNDRGDAVIVILILSRSIEGNCCENASIGVDRFQSNYWHAYGLAIVVWVGIRKVLPQRTCRNRIKFLFHRRSILNDEARRSMGAASWSEAEYRPLPTHDGLREPEKEVQLASRGKLRPKLRGYQG
ncbi:hypothetical protein EDB83DRAFT_2318714 [Lactarius deliciosus]|nr:hypothetical protein EDB83DRAFT_2318714 [Lactarius deliciosus]